MHSKEAERGSMQELLMPPRLDERTFEKLFRPMQAQHSNLDTDLFLQLKLSTPVTKGLAGRGDAVARPSALSLLQLLTKHSNVSPPMTPTSQMGQLQLNSLAQTIQNLTQGLNRTESVSTISPSNAGSRKRSAQEAALGIVDRSSTFAQQDSPTDRYKKWKMDDNMPLLANMIEKGRKWENIKEAVNSANDTKWTYGRVKHRCRHLLQEKRGQKKLTSKKPSSCMSIASATDTEEKAFLKFSARHLKSALALHAKFGNRFHRIRDFEPSRDAAFTILHPDLVSLHDFSIAKIETEILRNCACSLCRQAGLERLGSEKAFQEAWTKHKAAELLKLLRLHTEHKMDLEQIRSGMGWSQDWTYGDVEYRVRHVCNACESCSVSRKRSKLSPISSNQSESSGGDLDH